MTINRQSATISLAGDGINTSFSYPFEIPYAPDGSTPAVKVWITNPAVYPITPILVPSSSYAISGVGTNNGGTVTYPLSGLPLALGLVLTIERAYPYVQETSIANEGNFYPNAIEGALDLDVMEIQQLAAELARALLVPIGSGLDPDAIMAFLINLFINGGGGGGGGGGGTAGLGYRVVTSGSPSPAVLTSDHLGVISCDAKDGDISIVFLPSVLVGEQVTFIRVDSGVSIHTVTVTNGVSAVAILTSDQTSVTLKSTGLALVQIPPTIGPP